MDREGFRNRFKQYKKAREENPGLKYWEWKAIPKYDEGGEVLEQYYAPKTVEGIITKTAIQLADPTGVSSYPDVWYSGKKFLNSPSWSNLKDVGINTLSALPLIGKVTAPFKAAKMAKLLARIEDANALVKGVEHANRLNKVIDTVPELLPVVRRGAEKVQDVTSALMTNPIFNYISNQNKFDLVRNYRNMNAAVDAVNISNNTADVTQGIESLMGYSEGGQVEPDPLEVLERSKPKVAGVPINDAPLENVFSPLDIALGTSYKLAPIINRFLPNYGPSLGALVLGSNDTGQRRKYQSFATKKLDDDVSEFYNDIVIPMNPNNEVYKQHFVKQFGNPTIEIHPTNTMPDNFAADFNPNTNKIRIREDYLNSSMNQQLEAHEYGHLLDKYLPYDKDAQQTLNNSLKVSKNPISKDSDTYREKQSTKREAEFKAFQNLKKQGKLKVKTSRAKTKRYQEYLASATDEEILELLGADTAYKQDYLAGTIDIDTLRQQMIYAPTIAAGLVIPEYLLIDDSKEEQWI